MGQSRLHLEFEATNRCNIRCIHCPHEAISRPSGRLDWPTFEAVIRNVREHLAGERFSLSFSGMGEPLLNPLIYRFIQHVRDDAYTAFSTNALLLDESAVERLIDAGLDRLYVSFPADDPAVHSAMMGGASYGKSARNLRCALEKSAGKRLEICANLVVTRRNGDQVTSTRRFLHREGVDSVTVSLVHNRGGNLRDTSVCDVPPMPAGDWPCDVLAHTLFLDWRGHALICDHDLKGEYGYGDLVHEPLADVLRRREEMLAHHRSFPICRKCNDVLRIGNEPLLASGHGGSFRDWVLGLYDDSASNPELYKEPMRWIYAIARREGREEQLFRTLLGVEHQSHMDAQRILTETRRERDRLQALANQRGRALVIAGSDSARLGRKLREKDRELVSARVDRDRIQALLEARDRELAELHRKYREVRRSRWWRVGNAIAHDWWR